MRGGGVGARLPRAALLRASRYCSCATLFGLLCLATLLPPLLPCSSQLSVFLSRKRSSGSSYYSPFLFLDLLLLCSSPLGLSAARAAVFFSPIRPLFVSPARAAACLLQLVPPPLQSLPGIPPQLSLLRLAAFPASLSSTSSVHQPLLLLAFPCSALFSASYCCSPARWLHACSCSPFVAARILAATPLLLLLNSVAAQLAARRRRSAPNGVAAGFTLLLLGSSARCCAP